MGNDNVSSRDAMSSRDGYEVIVGVYTYLDDVINGIESVKAKGWNYKVYSPVPHHDLEHVTYPKRSPVRFITGLGAIAGLIGGFALATLTSLDYPLRVSAKEVDAIPSFIVVGFECTILLGGIATFIAMSLFCKLPNYLASRGFDYRFTQDKFGLVVGCSGSEGDEVFKVIEASGACEVNRK